MKHPALLLTLGLLGLAGCVTQPTPIAPPTRTVAATAPKASVAPVRAEQVTPQTAQKMSQALADELDREAQNDLAASAQKR